jgi:hypothetical protein
VGIRGAVLSSAQAVRVERRSVDAEEVRPPDDLLSLEQWFGATGFARDPAPAEQMDFELVLARDGAPTGAAMSVRSRYPWYHEDRYDSGQLRHLSIRRKDRPTTLDVYVGGRAPDRLTMVNGPFDEQTQVPDLVPVPLPEPPETLLGEPCIWMDRSPGMMDAGRHECRTRDGIPLRIKFWSRGWYEGYSATRLSRRPIEFAEVMPPPELLDRSRWRLPQ